MACGASFAQQPSAPPSTGAPVPSAYVDRVITTGTGTGTDTSASPSDDADEQPYDVSGWPRQLRLDLRGLSERANVGSRYRGGDLLVFGAMDTPNHGLWSLDAQLRREQRNGPTAGDQAVGASAEQSSLFTLRQRAFPLTSSITLNNELGAIGFATPSLSRMTSRVFVPGHRVLGGSTQWRFDDPGVQLAAALGQPLQYDGIFASRVQRIPGRLMQLGADVHRRLDGVGDVHLGAQTMQARAVGSLGTYTTSVAGLGATTTVPDRFNARSFWLGSGVERADFSAQVHGLSTQLATDTNTRSSQGAWGDAQWRNGAWRHSAGGYKLGDGLSWGGLPMASGLAGAYLRSGWATRTWLVDGGVDVLRLDSSRSGATAARSNTGYFATTNVRRRVHSDWSWGALASLRDFNGRAHALAADTTVATDWGASNLRADLQGDTDGQRTWRTTLHQDWAVEQGWSLSNSVAVGRTRQGAGNIALWAAAVSAFAPVNAYVTLRGTANVESAGGQQRRSVNLSGRWNLTSLWSVEAGASLEQGRGQSVRTIDPLAPPSIVAPQSVNAQSYFLLLRYELRAGSLGVPLGARSRTGGGAVEGTLYLDSNRNGRQDAGERGAAGVTVALNGKHLTQTDAQGRYSFPWVVPGQHQVTVLNETLPLPWAAPEDGRTEVVVNLRSTSVVNIAIGQP
jgi:hypothetical protein